MKFRIKMYIIDFPIVEKQKFKILLTSINISKIDNTNLKIDKIIIAFFLIINNKNKSCFFKKYFYL